MYYNLFFLLLHNTKWMCAVCTSMCWGHGIKILINAGSLPEQWRRLCRLRCFPMLSATWFLLYFLEYETVSQTVDDLSIPGLLFLKYDNVLEGTNKHKWRKGGEQGENLIIFLFVELDDHVKHGFALGASFSIWNIKGEMKVQKIFTSKKTSF